MARHIKSPTTIEAAGTPPKLIEEYVGRVNSATDSVSIARMKSPQGWVEPGQTPEFTEYTVVTKGTLHIRLRDSEMDIQAGEAVIIQKGEWVQYSSPGVEGAEYFAICVPAFLMETVHRDE